MDLHLHELQSLPFTEFLCKSVAIIRSAPNTFALITFNFVLPLSLAVLGHTFFTHIIFNKVSPTGYTTFRLLYQLDYLFFLLIFSLLSKAAVLFTVASLYAAKPVSFCSVLSAIPSIFPRLLRTFLWFSLLYNLPIPLLLFLSPYLPYSPSLYFTVGFVTLAFLPAHVFMSAWWHLASVVSVLEPLSGCAAMTKSRHLLCYGSHTTAAFASGYLGICGSIEFALLELVLKGTNMQGSWGIGVGAKILLGSALVIFLVVVNVVGLLVHSVFYFVCKSDHHEIIDKSELNDRLAGYLGEYVPLKCFVHMETL